MKQDYPQTLIVRHKRENKKKCTLQPIRKRRDCLFFTYPSCKLPDIQNYCLLSFEGEMLSKKDYHKGIILLDGTWKKAQQMEKALFHEVKIEKRSLSQDFKTAYPRKQTDCSNPDQGLASIEALYIAYLMMGRDAEGLLDDYYWRDEFLSKNAGLIQSLLG